MNDTQAQATYRVGTAQRSENELRLSYSIIIVRAVNGLVDPSQQGYFADSVASLAQRIGLPGWFVELRHDATHQQLPSLTMLRTAARHLVTWYSDNYWEPQRVYLQQHTAEVTLLDSACNESSALTTQCDVLKETTFLTNIFIPAVLRSIFTAVHHGASEAGEADGWQELREQQHHEWATALKTVLKKSPHTSEGAANTLVCHLVSTCAETVLSSDGLSSRDVRAAVALLAWWVQHVMQCLVDVLGASSTVSKSSDTELSSLQSSLVNNLQRLQQNVTTNDDISRSLDVSASTSLAVVCAMGLKKLNAAGRREFAPVVNLVTIIYGDGLFFAIRRIFLEEKVACSPYTVQDAGKCGVKAIALDPSALDWTTGKRKFSSNNSLTVQTKRLMSSSSSKTVGSTAVFGSGTLDEVSPAVSIDITQMRTWLNSPEVWRKRNRSGSDMSEFSDRSMTGSVGGDTEANRGQQNLRRSWPLGVPVGRGLQDGSLLHLLEEI